jgi:hypothetical protein
MRLDRDAALALEVHRSRAPALPSRAPAAPGQLEKTVGQRRLAVIDMGDDEKNCGRVTDP